MTGRGVPARWRWQWRVGILGYSLAIGSLIGATGDELWDNRFASANGVSGHVSAIASSDADLYVAGLFRTAGGIAATNIARWDGTQWSALGPGWGQGIYAIAASGSNVYIGGTFLGGAGLVAENIAKWDGERWSALGSGINGSVHALAIIDSDLFAAGAFTTAGEVAATNIAKWNGNAWEELGAGVNGPITMTAVNGRDLYVAGQFTKAGLAAATNIARWDGNDWSALGDGVIAPLAMTISDGSLYVMDTPLGAWSLQCTLKRWVETNWSAIVTQRFAINGDIFATIHGLAGFGGEIYVAGLFDNLTANAYSQPVNCVARYDGTNWWPAGSGFRRSGYAEVRQLVSSPSTIYAGGSFDLASGKSANSIAAWDGTNWSGLGIGLDIPGGINDLTKSGTNLYASGIFESPSTIGEGGLARWDGASWTRHAGLSRESTWPPQLTCLAASDDFIYAGLAWKELVRFDMTNWVSIGSATFSVQYYPYIFAVAASGTNVFIGGTFTGVNGVPANHIARWDGSRWSALRTGMSRSQYVPVVNVLAAEGGKVCAAGWFTSADGVSVNGLACWDGTNWLALGSGVDGTINAMRFISGQLYVAGSFTSAGGVPATNIAKWNGNNWSSVANGLDGPVSDFVFNGNDLYVAGSFTSAFGIKANSIAKWDGTHWHALGSGVNKSVSNLACNGSELFLSGAFDTAGNKPSAGFAIWDIPHALQIESAGPRALISWSATGTNFLLEASTRLPGTNWTEVASPRALIDDHLVVTNELDGASRFYRLRRE